MPEIVNKKVKLKASPGTCKLSVTGKYSSDVNIDKINAMIGKISFKSVGGNHPVLGLTGCIGEGKIDGTCSKVKIDGESAVIKSDTGICKGTGTDPNTGAQLPCRCTIKITDPGSSTVFNG